MVPVELRLRNFLSYGEDTLPLDFTGFRVACITGDNGHGKSALLDAITYALWGEARKGIHSRKPDEDLLRVGAGEMRVEFTFDLGQDRYRVVRSYRKRRRGGTAQLELQILDSSAGLFRPLSDSTAMARTQERIIQLLSMDYNTFINSAFIVQGRADEFSRKGALERKRVLGEILGLSRFDRLQEMARARETSAAQRREDCRRLIGDLDAQLASRAATEQRKSAAEKELTGVGAQLLQQESREEELRAGRAEALSLVRQRQQLGDEFERTEERLTCLRSEAERLRSDWDRDEELLRATAEIERDYDTHRELMSTERELTAQMSQHIALESEIAGVEGEIREQRFAVERRQEHYRGRCESIKAQRERLDIVLSESNSITERLEQLKKARLEEERAEARRSQHEELIHQRLKLVGHLEREEGRLRDRLALASDQVEETKARLAACGEMKARLEQKHREIDGLRKREAELERLREQGTQLGARLESARRRLMELQQTSDFLGPEGERVTDGAAWRQCPLCGSALDEAHRQLLERELADREAKRVAEVRALQGVVSAMENDLAIRRKRYRELTHRAGELENLLQAEAVMRARLTGVEEDERGLRLLDRQRLDLEKTLEGDDYAAEHRSLLMALDQRLETLGFCPDEPLKTRERIRSVRSAEADFKELDRARSESADLCRELEEASRQLQQTERAMADEAFGSAERRQLNALRGQLQDLSYDPERHRRVRLRLEGLSAAVARREHLEACRRRHQADGRQLEKTEGESEACISRLAELDLLSKTLEERALALSSVERDHDECHARVLAARGGRDELLQRLGSLKAQCERLDQVAAQRHSQADLLRIEERETSIYSHLGEAFGKDGIQALVIESALPEIEEEANAILRRLTDNRVRIAIESLRDLKKGGTRETLDITISDEIGERPYHLFSGGEAFRTDFALRIALSKVLARRAGSQLRTLIIDEGFGTQDKRGLECLKEAIQEISRDFDMLLVVTHLAELQDIFPVQIAVTKDPALGSRFEVVHQA